MSKINIIQFMPYFPPHKWWVETVWEEISDYWIKKQLWEVINVVFDVWQVENINYSQKWYKVFLLPSFDIIPNFPFPKFWKKNFWKVFLELNNFVKTSNEVRVISHTRFFISSLIAGLFSKINKLKWIHIEHGSDYVKLSSKLKSKISYIYDKIIWKWILKNSDKLLAISQACKNFINNEFVKKDVEVFYRWICLNINENFNKDWDIKIVFVWRLVYLKWIFDLIESYKKLNTNIELIIIWDWEDRTNLKEKSAWFDIKFIWYKSREFIINFLTLNNCILVNPSYSEWLPTTIIEWLLTKNLVIATNVWGTWEISNLQDLILYNPWDIISLTNNLKYALNNYENLVGISFNNVSKKFSMDDNILTLYNLIK